MLTAARNAVDGLLAALLAPPCVVCGRVAERPLDGAACESCWHTIRLITPPYCVCCGEPFPSTRTLVPAGPVPVHASGQRCARCTEHPPLVDAARALGPYEGTLRDLVHGLKYDGRRSIAPRLAALLHEGPPAARVDAVEEQAASRSTEFASPQASTSTRPSSRFLAQPVMLSASACSCVHARNATP